MINFIVRTDEHVSEEAPASRKDDYMESCLDKLRQIGEISSDKNADAVLDNGDFFHNPGTGKNSHELVRKVIDVHNEYYDCPVYENPGNHDFPYTRIDYLEKHALGVLFSTGVFRRMEEVEFTDGEGLKVRVVGLPYKTDFDLSDFGIRKEDEDVLIVAAHTFASLDGGPLWGDNRALSYFNLADFPPDMFIFGHLHVDQGIETVKGKRFMNLGSMTRGALVKDNLERIPRVGHIEIEKEDGNVNINTEAIDLDVKPAEDVFDLREHKRTKREEEKIDKFINSLSESSKEDDSSSIRDEIKSLNFPEKVRQKSLHYLKKVSS